MDRYVVKIYGQMNRQIDGWLHKLMDELINIWIDGWMDESQD